MLEIVLTSTESDQYSSEPKEITKFPLMYMTGYFCRSVYDKHVRNLSQQNLGIKPSCTSIPEQAALILLLKPVLSISSIRTTFLRHG